ncbi:hypothetical protein GW17_00059752 [Ensete ventricosum]|nr:hypothetical protein GW17_00059752 [Ensete ventricosum]
MEVTNEGDLANVDIIEPRKTMEEGIRLGADGVGGQGGDILDAGGYHRFCNPFSTAHVAMCVEEEGGMDKVHGAGREFDPSITNDQIIDKDDIVLRDKQATTSQIVEETREEGSVTVDGPLAMEKQ